MQFISFQVQARPGIEPAAALARLKRFDTILCERLGIGLVVRHPGDPSSFHGHRGVYEVRILGLDSYDEKRALRLARAWAALLDFEIVDPAPHLDAAEMPRPHVTVLRSAEGVLP